MANELQALLDRINEDGLKKADATQREILEKAQAEAQRALQESRLQAEKMVSDARQEADLLLEKGREALRQASRDVLLSLREQLRQRLQEVAKAGAGKAMNEQALAQMLVELIRAHAATKGKVERVEVLLNAKQLPALEQYLLAALGESLRTNCQLSPVPEVENGFKLIFNGEHLVYDFTDAALAETLAAFMNPKLADLVRGVVK